MMCVDKIGVAKMSHFIINFYITLDSKVFPPSAWGLTLVEKIYELNKNERLMLLLEGKWGKGLWFKLQPHSHYFDVLVLESMGSLSQLAPCSSPGFAGML